MHSVIFELVIIIPNFSNHYNSNKTSEFLNNIRMLKFMFI